MTRHAITFTLLLAALSVSPPARGAVITIGPFQGTYSEDFNNLPDGAQQEASIMGGFGTVRNLTEGGALKVEFSSSLGGVLVLPRSPPRMLGQLGISEWDFDTPVTRFGGYFANNSRFPDARVDFYDVNGARIDSLPALAPIARFPQDWIWNGWQSDVPIKSLVITGNDVEFFNGFIWFDDFEATPSPAPEPSSLVLSGLGGLIVALVYCGKRARSRVAPAG